MTPNSEGPQPQDRLPGEQPRADVGMPVIGPDGGLLHQPPAPTDPIAGRAPDGAVMPVATGSVPRGSTHVAVFSEVKRGRGAFSGAISVFGEVAQSGPCTVARRSKVVSVFGEVVLDLREATLAADDVRIVVIAAFGELKVIVPPGLDVDLSGFVALGEHRLTTTTPPKPGSPRVTVHAVGVFSEVKVVELAEGEREPSFLERLRGRR